MSGQCTTGPLQMGFKVAGVDLTTLGPLVVVRCFLGTQGRSGQGPSRGR